MKLYWIWIIGLFYGSVLMGQDAREISVKAMDIMEVDRMEMEARLLILDAKGRERSRRLVTRTGSFDGVTKTILKFTEPAEVKGTALLIYDYDDQPDDMWIFMPALRKTRRILSSDKGKRFMGSEFTHADMASPNPDDFTYRLIGEEQLDDHACWTIESRCKNDQLADEYGFSKKISWIEKETYLCYQVEFYDFDEELFKLQLMNDYRRDSKDRPFAWYMEMSNLDNGRQSVMKVEAYASGPSVSFTESSFTPALLER